MVLVEYSDSESDEDHKETQPEPQSSKKRKRDDDDRGNADTAHSPPPLPPSFHSLYATNVRTSTSDDPALHSGRKRQIPHVQGNWPTHVFLEWMPSKEQLTILDGFIGQAQMDMPNDHSQHAPAQVESKVHSFLRSELGVQSPLHVSLCAPLVLTTSSKDDFRDELLRALQNSDIATFSVKPSSLKWVSNFEKTRNFLILNLEQEPPDDELNQLLTVCNRVAAQHDLPTLYSAGNGVGVAVSKPDEDLYDKVDEAQTEEGTRIPTRDCSPPFHISIAWTLQHSQTPKPQSSGIGTVTSSIFNSEDLIISFCTVKLKIGNVVDDIPLRLR